MRKRFASVATFAHSDRESLAAAAVRGIVDRLLVEELLDSQGTSSAPVEVAVITPRPASERRCRDVPPFAAGFHLPLFLLSLSCSRAKCLLRPWLVPPTPQVKRVWQCSSAVANVSCAAATRSCEKRTLWGLSETGSIGTGPGVVADSVTHCVKALNGVEKP